MARGVRAGWKPQRSEEDLARAYFSLKDAGVPIHKALDHASQKSIYFYDPDDNLLEIVWERPNTREIFAQGRGDGDTPIEFERPGIATQLREVVGATLSDFITAFSRRIRLSELPQNRITL